MADLKVYNEEEVRQKLAKELPGWYVEEGLIQRLYKTDGWQTTWQYKYGAELVSIYPDTSNRWEFKVTRPPKDRTEALKLARAQFVYCDDIIYHRSLQFRSFGGKSDCK